MILLGEGACGKLACPCCGALNRTAELVGLLTVQCDTLRETIAAFKREIALHEKLGETYKALISEYQRGGLS